MSAHPDRIVIDEKPSRGEWIGGNAMSLGCVVLVVVVWVQGGGSIGGRLFGSAVLACFFVVGLALSSRRAICIDPEEREVTVFRNAYLVRRQTSSWPFERFVNVTLLDDHTVDSDGMRLKVGLRGLDHLDVHVDSFFEREPAYALAARLAEIFEVPIEEDTRRI